MVCTKCVIVEVKEGLELVGSTRMGDMVCIGSTGLVGVGSTAVLSKSVFSVEKDAELIVVATTDVIAVNSGT